MQSHLIINGVDYTPDIVDESYKIDVNDKYESWEDGNMVEHRVIVAQKVTGSVQILCSELGNWPEVSDFLADLNAATNNGVLTALFYVPARGAAEVIDCYYEIANVSHIKDLSGYFTDIFELKITER